MGSPEMEKAPQSEAQIAFNLDREDSITVLDCLQDGANNDYDCKDDFFHGISVYEKAPQMQGWWGWMCIREDQSSGHHSRTDLTRIAPALGIGFMDASRNLKRPAGNGWPFVFHCSYNK